MAAQERDPAEGGREEVDEALRRQEERRARDEARRRAEELAQQAETDNPDPTTRREAIEQALEAEGLSEEGEKIGQHIE